jgi:ABC-2 type transport system ATP-binding protein
LEIKFLTDIVIQTVELTKRFGNFIAVDKLNLSVHRGETYGFLGPNGAGKSTAMRIMMGLVRPDQGEVNVLGKRISSNEASAKQDIGYFSDDMRLYKPETLGWHMQFVRSMFPSWDDAYAKLLLKRFGLIEERQVRGLSHGQRVKAMLLLILARKPKLLILDEPTDGLDPVAKHEILTELMRVVEDEERTILFSSHNTQDVEQICDSITFIDRGSVVDSRACDVFLESWRRLKLTVNDGWESPKLGGVTIDSSFRTLRVLTTDCFSESLVSQLVESGAQVDAVEPMTLEEIFVSVVLRGREGVVS